MKLKSVDDDLTKSHYGDIIMMKSVTFIFVGNLNDLI